MPNLMIAGYLSNTHIQNGDNLLKSLINTHEKMQNNQFHPLVSEGPGTVD